MSDEMDCDVCAGTGKPVSGLPCICGGTGSNIDEKAGLRRKVHELELQVSELQQKLDVEDAAHDQTIMERDGFEETLTQLAADAGCTEEWSNLHAHGDCITNLWDAKVKEDVRLNGEKDKHIALLEERLRGLLPHQGGTRSCMGPGCPFCENEEDQPTEKRKGE